MCLELDTDKKKKEKSDTKISKTVNLVLVTSDIVFFIELGRMYLLSREEKIGSVVAATVYTRGKSDDVG